MAAVAGTPLPGESQVISPQFYEAFSRNLDILGNEMQATGNALIADSQFEFTHDKVGSQVQSVGNLVNVAGFLLDVSEQVEIKFNIKGNLIQATGGSLSYMHALNEEQIPVISFYSIYGNLLQVIGNSMQSLSGILELRGEDGVIINTIGGWVQATGSILTLVATIKLVDLEE